MPNSLDSLSINGVSTDPGSFMKCLKKVKKLQQLRINAVLPGFDEKFQPAIQKMEKHPMFHYDDYLQCNTDYVTSTQLDRKSVV